MDRSERLQAGRVSRRTTGPVRFPLRSAPRPAPQSGTVLVMVVALLAMFALMATTFLVTARYDRVGTEGAALAGQMEILLSMLEGVVRRELAEDLWGDNVAANNPGDGAHEGYDAPDANHPWLRGVCGKLIDWESPGAAPPEYAQYVLEDKADWIDLPGDGSEEVSIRYCALIQDLGGLINVNVCRRPDPDLVGENYNDLPDPDHPEGWPHTIWAFHHQRGKPDWGYWWYTATERNAFGHKDLFGGMGRPIRGGGPLQNVDLRSMLASPGELSRIDAYFRQTANYGRNFDIQDELDLRFPGLAYGGSSYPSMLELILPSLFSDDRPSYGGGQIPSHRRRLVTAIARTSNWQVRREPILMHPYPDAFWDAQPDLDRNLCQEWWYWKFDYPHFDDMIKYYNEARMGYRMSLQRGVTFSRMWPDDPFYIYDRLMSHYGADAFPPLAGVADFPAGRPWETRAFPPYQYNDWLTDFPHRDEYPIPDGNYAYTNGATMIALLLGNVMAFAGVPDPSKNPDDPDAYQPATYAHIPAQKESRVRAYRKFVGTMHLNLEDYQDPNDVPAMLRGDSGTKLRFFRYGDRAGAEDRPYMTEAVFEFEVWPDYAIIWSQKVSGAWTLPVYRVDAGSSAETKGLRVGDAVTGIRTPNTAGAFVKTTTLAELRTYLRPMRPGQLIDLQINRGGTTAELAGISLGVAVRSVAVEVYNPHDHAILVHDTSFYNSPMFRYNVGVQQQFDYTSGGETKTDRAFILHTPPGYAPVRELGAGETMLFAEFRASSADSNMTAYGLDGIPYYETSGHRWRSVPVPCEHGNLTNLREDGDLILGINHFIGNWVNFAYLSDVFRNQPAWAVPPPTPATGTVLPTPHGIRDAFAAARARIDAGIPNPAVRLYRPRYMETRATQYMTVSDTWMNGSDRSPAASRLGRRGADEDDFAATVGADYRNIDARGYYVTATNRGFRFGADLSRVTRLTQPRLKDRDSSYSGDAKRQQRICDWPDVDEEGEPYTIEAPTEVIDRGIRSALAAISALEGEKTLSSKTVRQILQKFEARLRYSPYTPRTPAELAECRAWHAFLDAFTVGGAAYDNLDNNGNGVADEHGTHDYDLGLPEDIVDTDPGGWWLKEHSNCWPAYGRINVNTAPREVLEAALLAPTDAVRRGLAQAIWTERGGEASQGNTDYAPFKTLGDLYGRVSVLNGYDGTGKGIGFDWFGFDSQDNHNGSHALPDMNGWQAATGNTISLDPEGYVDDLDERNYLWRINSELTALRTDTFAMYLRFQARRKVNDQWKVLSERRVYSIWDRANCIWPPMRHDGTPHPDFVPPQRMGIQIFSY